MTDELIDALARVPRLRVTSRSSSFAFKGSRLGARAIGDSLGVAMVIEGSVRKSGSQLRITTQLTRVTDGSAIWSSSYDRELRDVFAVQEELARSILGALQTTIGDTLLVLGAANALATLVRRTTSDRDAAPARPCERSGHDRRPGRLCVARNTRSKLAPGAHIDAVDN